MQVLFATVLIDALHAALEDREVAFHGIAVDRAILKVHVFAASVAGRAVPGKVLLGLADPRAHGGR